MSSNLKEAFPDSDAWAASMPDLKGGFAASSVRKAASVEPAATGPADVEYKRFASLDLSNM